MRIARRRIAANLLQCNIAFKELAMSARQENI
jgi:hypothetical protein